MIFNLSFKIHKTLKIFIYVISILYFIKVENSHAKSVGESMGDFWNDIGGSFSNSNGPEPKTARVLRGGSFDYSPAFAKSSGRSYYSPTSRSNLVGFRLVRTK
jgi:formylglycine-generating enzyme required for sulfatase activity